AGAAVTNDILRLERAQIAVTRGERLGGEQPAAGGDEVLDERRGARAGDVARASIDGLAPALEALAGAHVEDHRARIAGEARHVVLADHASANARARAGREIEDGRGRDHGDLRGERVSGREPRAEAAVEHAAAFEADPAQHPPEAGGDGSTGVV